MFSTSLQLARYIFFSVDSATTLSSAVVSAGALDFGAVRVISLRIATASLAVRRQYFFILAPKIEISP